MKKAVQNQKVSIQILIFFSSKLYVLYFKYVSFLQNRTVLIFFFFIVLNLGDGAVILNVQHWGSHRTRIEKRCSTSAVICFSTADSDHPNARLENTSPQKHFRSTCHSITLQGPLKPCFSGISTLQQLN